MVLFSLTPPLGNPRGLRSCPFKGFPQTPVSPPFYVFPGPPKRSRVALLEAVAAKSALALPICALSLPDAFVGSPACAFPGTAREAAVHDSPLLFFPFGNRPIPKRTFKSFPWSAASLFPGHHGADQPIGLFRLCLPHPSTSPLLRRSSPPSSPPLPPPNQSGGGRRPPQSVPLGRYFFTVVPRTLRFSPLHHACYRGRISREIAPRIDHHTGLTGPRSACRPGPLTSISHLFQSTPRGRVFLHLARVPRLVPHLGSFFSAFLMPGPPHPGLGTFSLFL